MAMFLATASKTKNNRTLPLLARHMRAKICMSAVGYLTIRLSSGGALYLIY